MTNFTDFNVSIKGINEFEGEESNIIVTTLTLVPHIAISIVQYCLLDCAILFSKTSFKFDIVLEQENTFKNLELEDLKFNYKLSSFSLTDTTDNLYLVVEKKRYFITIKQFLEEAAIEKPDNTLSYKMITAAVMVTILVVVLLGIFIYLM